MDTRPTDGLGSLLAQRRPQLRTRAALLVLDVQNDFISPAGKMPLTLPPDFLAVLRALIASFRSQGHEIIWVRSEYRGPREVNSPDGEGDVVLASASDDPEAKEEQTETPENEEDSEDELLRAALTAPSLGSNRYRSAARTRDILQRISAKRAGESRPAAPHAKVVAKELFLSGFDEDGQCCLPKSLGAESPFQVEVRDSQRDMEFIKSHYSGFNSTNLLTSLRSKIITELYFCGCLTNVSVYATVVDAARHGFAVSVVRDCLAYQSLQMHEDALVKMSTNMGVDIVSSSDLIPPSDGTAQRELNPSSSDAENAAALRLALESLSLDKKRQSLPDYKSKDPASRNRLSLGKVDASQKRTRLPTLSKSGRRPTSNGDLPENLSPNQIETRALPPTKIPSPARVESPRVDMSLSRTSTNVVTSTIKASKFASLAPILGPNDRIGEGDSRIIYDVDFPLGQDLSCSRTLLTGPSSDVFLRIKNEVKWQKMYHVSGEVPRLVSVQGQFGSDGSMPVYRHPSDKSLPLLRFSPQVEAVKKVVESYVGHAMNHVLVQLYRRGEDYISEHSDKTLDIVRGSNIVNVSFGAQRTMRLRTKKSRYSSSDESEAGRETQKVPMPHSSVFVLGPQTNMRWLHGIQPDKRAHSERSESELAYNGERISLTFRNIGTFLSTGSTEIWGQGACSKEKHAAKKVINANPAETERLVYAFGIENQSSNFDWDAIYGHGFDVLHFTSPPDAQKALLYLSTDYASNLSCKICLEEFGVPYEQFGVLPAEAGTAYRPTISFHDTDSQMTQVDDIVPILFYLGRFYSAEDSKPVTAQALPLVLEYTTWRQTLNATSNPARFLSWLNTMLEKREFLSGTSLGIADCAYWPLVDEALESSDEDGLEFAAVLAWHERIGNSASVRKAMWSDAEG